MGCSISKEKSSLERNILDNSNLLTLQQKELIRETWKKLSPNMCALGTQVFLYLFDRHPGIKRLFPFRDSWGDELIHHPQFVAHAMRFIKIVESAVVHMDCLERDYSLALLLLGQKHQSIPGFCPEHFGAFRNALVYIIVRELKGESNLRLVEAWDTLITFIIDKLREGHGRNDLGRRLSTQYNAPRTINDGDDASLDL